MSVQAPANGLYGSVHGLAQASGSNRVPFHSLHKNYLEIASEYTLTAVSASVNACRKLRTAFYDEFGNWYQNTFNT